MEIQRVYGELKKKWNPEGRRMSLHGKNVSFTTSGNQILDQDRTPFRVKGVSKSGLEYFYIDYSVYTEEMIEYDLQLMRQWKINTVRIPLRDSHWLSQKQYQTLVLQFIQKCLENAILVILDLHTQGDSLGLERFMKRSENALLFWQDISERFQDNPAVFFEVFNEPHDIDAQTWWNGSTEYVGYKEVLTVIRRQAENICILGGLDWAFQWSFLRDHPNILTELLHFKNIVASTHPYGYKGGLTPIPVSTIFPKGNTTGDCSLGVTVPLLPFEQYGWNTSFGFLHEAQQLPVIATEFGLDRPDNCLQGGWYNRDVLRYLDTHQMGYVAWAWIQERLDYPSLLSKDLSPTGKASFTQEGPACGCAENGFYKGPGWLVYDHLQSIKHRSLWGTAHDQGRWSTWPFLLGVCSVLLFSIWRPKNTKTKDEKCLQDTESSSVSPPSLHYSMRIRSCSSLPRLQESV